MRQRILKAVTVRFEEPVCSQLEQMAQREHRTMADQIRHLVAVALSSRMSRPPHEH